MESWQGSAQLPLHYVSYHLFMPPYFIDTHTHHMQGHLRKDCVIVICVYMKVSVTGCGRMCVYMCVVCMHS